MAIDGTTGPDTLTGTLGDDVINAFGGKEGFEKAVHELQDALYQESA